MNTTSHTSQNAASDTPPTRPRFRRFPIIVVLAAFALVGFIGVGFAVWKARGDASHNVRQVARDYVTAVLERNGSQARYELKDLPDPLLAATESIYKSKAADWSWLEVGEGYRIGEVWGAATGGAPGLNDPMEPYAVAWRQKGSNGTSWQEGTLVWKIVRVEVIAKDGVSHWALLALRPTKDSPVIVLNPDNFYGTKTFSKWGVVPISRDGLTMMKNGTASELQTTQK